VRDRKGLFSAYCVSRSDFSQLKLASRSPVKSHLPPIPRHKNAAFSITANIFRNAASFRSSQGALETAAARSIADRSSFHIAHCPELLRRSALRETKCMGPLSYTSCGVMIASKGDLDSVSRYGEAPWVRRRAMRRQHQATAQRISLTRSSVQI
jgi:hypothetical protein